MKRTKTKLVSGPIFRVIHQSIVISVVILEFSLLIRLCMANGQPLPIQFVGHTKPYKNYNFQTDGTLQYFGV